jgi:hypothetical protein
MPQKRNFQLEELLSTTFLRRDDITPSCRVYNSVNIPIATSSTTILTFDSQRWDSHGLHTVGTSRLTCKRAGLYHIFGHIVMPANTSGVRSMAIILNGVTPIANQRVNGSSVFSMLSVSTMYLLSAGDYIELRVWQTSGGSLDISADPNRSPEFGMTYIGRVN